MREFIGACVLAALAVAQAALPQPALAQAYPSKPVYVIVPFAPGGGADTTARAIADKLGPALGQTVVVENRPGGLTVIGADAVAKAPSDGYTLFLMPGTHVLSRFLVKNVPFDPIRDFTPISMLATISFAFFADPKLPFSNMKDMIAYARANPDKLSVGTSDALSRLAVELLNNLAKIKLTNVNYKAAGRIGGDVVGGHLQMGVVLPTPILGFYRDKRLNALGITGPNRIISMPDVPSVAEAAGLPEYNIQTWFALAGPASLPKPIVTQLQQHIHKIVGETDVRARLVNLGMEPATDTTPEKAASVMRIDNERIGKMIQVAGIKPE